MIYSSGLSTRRNLIFILVFLCSIGTVLANEIHVTVSRQTVQPNESITVVFTSDQPINGQPDFSPLELDFTILSHSKSSNTSITNGKIHKEIQWTLALMSKHEGQVTIPPIQFGKYRSMPKTIQVNDASQTKQDDTLFLEVDVSPKTEVYEQSQVIYTTRLYRSVNISNGSLAGVQVNDKDAIIEKLGEDIEYEHFDKGKRFIVIERKYAVFPQHPGELIFAPMVFKGQIVTGRHSFFDIQAQHVRLKSDPETIDVKPIPAQFTQKNWFPANEVTISEDWSEDLSSIVVGEPITRTITVKADGCLASQIPAVSMNLSTEIKQYPDKPQLYNQDSSQGYLGIRQVKVALIPTKPGSITLPEVRLKWWDVNNNDLREATLPERLIHVATGPVELADNTATEIPLTPQQLPVIDDAGPLNSTEKSPLQTLPLWAWLLIGLNVFWLICLLIVLRKKASTKRDNTEFSAKRHSLSRIKKNLKKACHANDAKQAEKQLLAWAEYMFPQVKPLNLPNIKDHLSEALQEAFDDLNEALYSPNATWHGKGLWKAFVAYKPPKVIAPNQNFSKLRQLYD